MTESQYNKIQNLTGYSYEEILKMSNSDFFFKIYRLIVKGTLTRKQVEWLDKMRKTGGKTIPNQVQDLLDTFGGTLV